MAAISLAAAFWVGLHLIVAGPLRVRLVRMLGERAFGGIFSLLSIVGVVGFVFAYRAAPWIPLWPTIPAVVVSRAGAGFSRIPPRGGRHRADESDRYTRPSDDR